MREKELLLPPAASVEPAHSTLEREADQAASQVMAMKPAGAAASHPVSGAASHGPGGGEPLSADARGFFESRFGRDFSGVRIHADASANKEARSLNARAFTLGQHISFGRDEYQPGTRAGRELMAHELAHVVQQSGETQANPAQGTAPSLSRAPSGAPQCKFIATGLPADFVEMVNHIVTVQYRIGAFRTGELYIESTGVQGPPQRDALELIEAIRKVIDDPRPITIEFVRGDTSARQSDKEIVIGNFDLGRVDLAAAEKFGHESSYEETGASASHFLVHEIIEQYHKQTQGVPHRMAHADALIAQERAAGARILEQVGITQPDGSLEIHVKYQYPDGRVVDTTFKVDKQGQILDLRRVDQ